MDKSDNIIINVGRQIGSGGHDVARLLAERFACKFYDKEILNLAARESGFCQRFITADMESRINVIAGRLGCSKEDARKAIVSGENKRSTYYNFYTGKQWGHSESYDLCVNTSRLGIERSVDIVTTFIENATNAKP